MEAESKRRVIGEDRISALPDAVVSHILDFFGRDFTKCAVSTGILSKRWKNMWASVPNVYFDNHRFSSLAVFVPFVDRALVIRDSTAIRKFFLHVYRFHADYFSHIDSWIETAVRLHVEEFDLFVDTDEEDIYLLPDILCTCTTLRVLKLRTSFIINLPNPTSKCFTSLKRLFITFDHPTEYFPGTDSFDFSCFPFLERLTIDGSLGDDGYDFHVHLPELKILRIRLYPAYYEREALNFHINAPKLEKFTVTEGVLSNYTIENAKSLVEAKVLVSYECVFEDDDEQDESANRANKLLAGISSVKSLCLSHPFSKVCSVAAFDNLHELELMLDDDYSEWSMLIKLLEKSFNLESLVLEHEKDYPNDNDEGGSHWVHTYRDRSECLEVPHWSPPEFVPTGFMSHLKSICIKGFKGKGYFGYKNEKELLKYLLKNGQVLQKMTIYTPGLSKDAEEELHQEFSTFEWGSRTCQVEIIKKEFGRRRY